MAIIAFLNQKGGVGKSTLSIHVATALALRGGRVLLVDADPQHSALDRQEAREVEPLFSVVGIPTKALHRDVAIQAKTHDHIVIDGPPRGQRAGPCRNPCRRYSDDPSTTLTARCVGCKRDH